MNRARDVYYRYKDSNEINTDSLMNLMRNYISELEQHQELIPRLNAIYKEFGEERQLDKLSEECLEFYDTWNDFDSQIYDMMQEIADVFIVSAQLVLNNPDIMEIVNQKLDRTEKRIKEGYYK